MCAASDQGLPAVSVPLSGSAGKGVQTSGPRVVRSIRLIAASSEPADAAGGTSGAFQVLSAFQRATIAPNRRKTGTSRSAHRAIGTSLA